MTRWIKSITSTGFVFFCTVVGAESVQVSALVPEKVQSGRVAFVKPSVSKIIEMDLDGKVTWEYTFPRKYLRPDFSMGGGADIEWLPKTDSFLVAIPKVGAVEVSRSGQVVWEYLTEEISHDADLLADGTIVFVNGWDGDGSFIFTRIDRSGRILERYRAQDIGLDKADRRLNFMNEIYSNTHANAVQFLAPGRYLLSLRNYNMAVVLNAGKIESKIQNVRSIHDPVDLADGIYFIRQDGLSGQRVVRLDKNTEQRGPLFETSDPEWRPMRTLEPLANRNFLITGSTVIGQVSRSGELVWKIKLNDFENQLNSSSPHRDFIYKAAFVYK